MTPINQCWPLNFASTTSILSWGDWFLSVLVPTLMSLWILTTPFSCNFSCIWPINSITSLHGPAMVVPALCNVHSKWDSLAILVIVVTSSDTDALLVPIGIMQTSARQWICIVIFNIYSVLWIGYYGWSFTSYESWVSLRTDCRTMHRNKMNQPTVWLFFNYASFWSAYLKQDFKCLIVAWQGTRRKIFYSECCSSKNMVSEDLFSRSYRILFWG